MMDRIRYNSLRIFNFLILQLFFFNFFLSFFPPNHVNIVPIHLIPQFFCRTVWPEFDNWVWMRRNLRLNEWNSIVGSLMKIQATKINTLKVYRVFQYFTPIEVDFYENIITQSYALFINSYFSSNDQSYNETNSYYGKI